MPRLKRLAWSGRQACHAQRPARRDAAAEAGGVPGLRERRLSSVAYAPDEIFLMLEASRHVASYAFRWQIEHRRRRSSWSSWLRPTGRTCRPTSSGGGDYEVATVNLGPKAGLTVASALLVDYVLTVAVSISSGVQYAARRSSLRSGQRGARRRRGIVVFLTAMNLRGVRESGTTFAVPTYLFLFGILGMGPWASSRTSPVTCRTPRAPSFTLLPEAGVPRTSAASQVFLLLRAFSSGLRRPHRCRGDQQRCPRLPASPRARTPPRWCSWAPVDHDACASDPCPQASGPASRSPRTPRTAAPQTASRSARLPPGHRDRPARRAVFADFHARRHTSSRSSPASSSSSRRTRPSTASRCSARSSPGTATCRGSCTPAGTGWPSATASSSSLGPRSSSIVSFDAEGQRSSSSSTSSASSCPSR